jgi:hypothetical protein
LLLFAVLVSAFKAVAASPAADCSADDGTDESVQVSDPVTDESSTAAPSMATSECARYNPMRPAALNWDCCKQEEEEEEEEEDEEKQNGNWHPSKNLLFNEWCTVY